MEGNIVSHYRILEKIGEGGMGIVYKAEDTRLGRLVALKFLPARLNTSPQDKARFIQEARAASSLNHPNVCTIHDIEEHDGQLFIVMELVEGQTLREKLPSVNQAKGIDIGIQIAEGLSAAHEKGIVHRDIKPENIMVRKDGIVQIMDFGLAKLRANGSKITRLTKEGSTVGTAGYMSPEQVQGQDADHRSDIFSLGAILYEIFTGELPFKGVHETALMYEIVNVDPVPMSAIKPELDVELDRIVLECLQKDPDERYNAVKDVAKDLKRFKRESSKARMSRTFQALPVQKSSAARAAHPAGAAPAEAPASSMRAVILWAVAAFIAGAVVVAAMWQPWKGPPQSGGVSARFTIRLEDSALIPLGVAGLSISPNGKFMAFTLQEGAGTRMAIRPTDREILEPVRGSDFPAGNVGTPSYHSFSPDGEWICFTTGDDIKKASVFGGAPVTICAAGSQPRGMWWGLDKNIYFGRINAPIMRVGQDGGTPSRVTTLDTAGGEISHRFPDLLPDGHTLLFTIKFNNISTFDDAAIAITDLRNGDRKILLRGGTFARYVPTGHIMYSRGDYIYAVPFDMGKGILTGTPKQLFKGGWPNSFSGESNYAFSDDGTLVYIPRGAASIALSTIVWIDRKGTRTSLLDTAGSYYITALSPDGEKIALHSQAANDDVWIYHMGRKSLTRLTFGGGNNGFPVWSADGKYVMYTSEHGRGQNIFRKSWDGTGQVEQLTTGEVTQQARAASPDGKYLAYVQNGDIWLLSLDGSGKTRQFTQTPANEDSPVFSPDGRYLAYQTDESGHLEVNIVPFPGGGGKWQVSTGGGFNPLWSPSGNELYYTRGTAIYSVAIHAGSGFDFSAPTKVLDLPPDGAFVAGVSPDNQRFALVTLPFRESSTDEYTLVTNWFQDLRNAFLSR